MIQIESYKNFDIAEWREIISGLNGNAFHLPEILLVGNNPENLVYLIFRKGEDIIAACVGLNLGRNYLKIIRGPQVLNLPTVPAFLDKEGVSKKESYNSLLSFAKEAGYKTIELSPRWGEDFRDIPELSGYVDRSLLIEFTIDLKKDMDTLYKEMHKKHRKNIRKASGDNLIIEHENSLEGFLMLRKMQEASSERASERGNYYNIQEEKFYRESYEKIYRNGLGNIIFAKKDGECIAGLAYLAFGRKAITVRSGATEQGYETSAMYLLQYELIRYLKEREFSELNIGGVPHDAINPSHPQHGLYNFKKEFGGTPHIRTGIKIQL